MQAIKGEVMQKLKMAIKKIKILLNLAYNNWRVAAATAISGRSTTRRLSFGDRPGLRAYVAEDDDDYDDIDGLDLCHDHGSTESSWRRSRRLRRAMRRWPEYDVDIDVDRRAEAFIANFHNQLKYERQISLECLNI
ncbi:uncharacterized protein LOC127264041 [Andrographis paniculata]|uniref:uncharacterized protein LOC127264041 n=1 Tax=Andrographis paniculata TaxID=175694 RepID=UPI0021E85957|nr:uncharacterized protein LOC127264041 [Andrographis paniculata]